MAEKEHSRFDCMPMAWLSLFKKKTIQDRVMDGVFWCVERDVYAYGVIVISMLKMKVVDKDHTADTIIDLPPVKAEYEREKRRRRADECSLACPSFFLEQGYHHRDAHVVTVLGMQCMEKGPKLRPKMNKVFKRLQTLRIVRDKKRCL
ncbi:putative serine/threonine-protein kinase NAK-like protein [Corchorus capsularis]|uniref:Putative serine/threonine-protein kinase NAK-like protein n=1 Tax=Corchorus capsularis TaxID=210143 RepID=A0A1R3K964_COCAP|nr:putative serine/threonine-protein kinase NAK-like protein [Corchorus capsularis]